MLNELFSLNSSMETARISRVGWHDSYKQCPKIPSFFLLIGADGTIQDLEKITPMERIRSMRKYEVSNGFSFPAFNVPPLFWAKSDEARQLTKKLKEIFQPKNGKVIVDREAFHASVSSIKEICQPLWTHSERERISKCLTSAGLSQKIGNSLQLRGNCQSIFELIERSAKICVNELQSHFLSKIVAKLEKSPLDPTYWVDTLLVSSSRTFKKVQIVVELADRSSFQYPANHPKAIEFLNRLLMESLHAAGAGNSGSDAFGWAITDDDFKTTFPSVRLPRLGDTKLRAMNKESPCQKRYNVIGSESFPAGSKIRQAMKDSLEWLGNELRKGKTWEDVSDTCGYDRALLFVYPSALAEDPPGLAGLFQSSDTDGQKFEAAAARVLPALKGTVQDVPNAQMRIFILAKADRARTKILLSKDYSVSTLLKGAADWRSGCENIPPIRLNIGSMASPSWIDPVTPFPAQAVKSLNVAWLEGGRRTDTVYGLGIGEGVALLLETGPSLRTIVNRALSLLVVNARPLLFAIGHADHRRDGSIKLDSRYKTHANLLPSLLGLLLFKQNFKKGMYMHSAPFLVGRLFALADLLHAEYCKHVRKDSLPSQLIGNALMPSVIDHPERGLARLAERLRIYQSWANTAHGEDCRLAKWALIQAGEVSLKLAGLDLPNCTNDSDKAQILLGYLARLKNAELNEENGLTIDSDKEA
ncbi:MAG: hypothetical protein ACP5VS_08320 [Desulfomonilaceae bacterium]